MKEADLPQPSFWILEINHTTTLRKVTLTKRARQHLEKITQKREDQTEHPVVSTNFQFQTSLLNEWLDSRTKESLVGILTITMLQTLLSVSSLEKNGFLDVNEGKFLTAPSSLRS